MNNLEIEEGQLKEALDLVRQGLELLNLEPQEFGRYMFEKISEDRNIHAVKSPLVTENDRIKIEYNTRKAFFLLVEYMSVQLMKKI